MSVKHSEIFEALTQPFTGNDVKTRKGGGGRDLSYVTARTVQNRLDNVLGPSEWWPTYTETKDGIKCALSIRLPDGTVVTKEDGGGFADMPAEDDCEKSGYCLPLNAQALTRNGWKEYHELGVGQDILAYDAESGVCRWAPIQHVTVFDEPCQIVQLQGKSFHMLCTPNHRWVVNRRDKGVMVKQTRELDSRDAIINAATAEGGDHPLTPREAAILGWLATDGSVVRGSRDSEERAGTQFHATIHQSKEPYRTEIRELLGGDAVERVLEEGERTFPGHKVASVIRERSMFRLRNVFAKSLLKKAGIVRWPDLTYLVTRLSAPARAAMLKAMLDADGHHHKPAGQVTFGKKSKPGVMEAFEILATLEGVSLGTPRETSTGLPIRTLRRQQHVWAKSLEITPRRPIAVWCPTTSYGTWVTRWNSTITITGNSDAFKRAAVVWGIARHLYRDGTPHYGSGAPSQAHPAPTDPGRGHREEVVEGYRQHREERSNGGGGRDGSYGPPKTGKALYAYAMKCKENGDTVTLAAITKFGKANGLPFKTSEWPEAAVVDCYAAITQAEPGSEG